MIHCIEQDYCNRRSLGGEMVSSSSRSKERGTTEGNMILYYYVKA